MFLPVVQLHFSFVLCIQKIFGFYSNYIVSFASQSYILIFRNIIYYIYITGKRNRTYSDVNNSSSKPRAQNIKKLNWNYCCELCFWLSWCSEYFQTIQKKWRQVFFLPWWKLLGHSVSGGYCRIYCMNLTTFTSSCGNYCR